MCTESYEQLFLTFFFGAHPFPAWSHCRAPVGEQTDLFPFFLFFFFFSSGTLIPIISDISVGRVFAVMTLWIIDKAKKAQE